MFFTHKFMIVPQKTFPMTPSGVREPHFSAGWPGWGPVSRTFFRKVRPGRYPALFCGVASARARFLHFFAGQPRQGGIPHFDAGVLLTVWQRGSAAQMTSYEMCNIWLIATRAQTHTQALPKVFYGTPPTTSCPTRLRPTAGGLLCQSSHGQERKGDWHCRSQSCFSCTRQRLRSSAFWGSLTSIPTRRWRPSMHGRQPSGSQSFFPHLARPPGFWVNGEMCPCFSTQVRNMQDVPKPPLFPSGLVNTPMYM